MTLTLSSTVEHDATNMCGVIGVYLTDVTKEDIALVERIFRETMIRGKHATGVTYSTADGLKTIKEPIPVTEFLEKYSIEDFVFDDTLKLIGHIRYSTSDLRYNQPFQGDGISIAHNGVISQDPDIWEYKTRTLNDSELILRCIEAGDHPLEVYKDRSMSVVSIEEDRLHAFRNHERPLWRAERWNGCIFASTQDILARAGVAFGVSKCDPMIHYKYDVYSGLIADETYYDPHLEDLQC